MSAALLWWWALCGRRWALLHGFLPVCFFAACVGCVVLQTRSAAARDDTPGQAIGPEKVTPEELRASVMGFVETYSAVMSQAADDLLQHGQPTPERRLMAQLTKLASVESAVTIATSPNPMTALLDLMVLLALQRQTWEEYWMPRIWGEDGRPMFAATTRLEAEIWSPCGASLQTSALPSTPGTA